MTIGLVIAATLVAGFLAGEDLDRAIVQMPAWRRVGPVPWAVYSRNADLRNGLIFYPILAIGAALLTWAAAISFHLDATAPSAAAFPMYAAAALVLGGLLATLKAAPQMLSLRRIGDDPLALQRAFDRFERWGTVRGICQVLAFLANVWSLVAIALYASFGTTHLN